MVGVGAEQVLALGGLDDPVVALELGLELAGPPAGEAGEHPGPTGDGGKAVHVAAGGHEPDVAQHGGRGLRGIVELRQHDHAGGLHRPADVHVLVRVDELAEVGDGLVHRVLAAAV